MSLEDNFNFIYTIFVAPIGVAFHKIYSVSSRLAVVEATQNLKKKDVEDLQKCMKDLTGKVEHLSGQIEEHFRNNSS